MKNIFTLLWKLLGGKTNSKMEMCPGIHFYVETDSLPAGPHE